jgi:chromosome segregation ATPase
LHCAAELNVFLSSKFDEIRYLSSILSQQEQRHIVDASTVTNDFVDHTRARLVKAVAVVDAEIKQQVGSQHDELLEQVKVINELEAMLLNIHQRIQQLHLSIQRVKHELQAPYVEFKQLTTKLQWYKLTSHCSVPLDASIDCHSDTFEHVM